MTTDEEKLSRYRKFVETLEQHTNNFDEFCDCGEGENGWKIDSHKQGYHDPDCMTLNWRKDVERLEE